MRKEVVGLLYGMAAGIIDVIPMIIQKLTWDANLAAFLHWIIVGFLISITTLKLHSALKGLVISYCVLLPTAMLIAWKEPMSLIPIFFTTLILGSILGWAIDKTIIKQHP